MTAKCKDVLDEMTKDELILWIRSRVFQRPRRSEILFMRWEKQSQKNLDDQQKEAESFAKIDLKRRDQLAVRFNESRDTGEKLRLLKEVQRCDEQVQAHIRRIEKLDKERKRIEKLYEQIDIERQKEHDTA